MSKFIRWIKTIIIAMINMCLLCGASHVLDWMGFVFNKTSRAGRRIKQYCYKSILNSISPFNKRSSI